MKSFRVFCGLLTVLFLTTAALAQPRQISAQDYSAAFISSMKLAQERTYRSESKAYKVEADNPVLIRTEIREILPPNRSRYVRIGSLTGSEPASERTEILRIDFMQYTKLNDLPWTALDTRNKGGTGYGSGSGTNCVAHSLEDDMIDGESLKKFRSFIVGNATFGLSYDDWRFWVRSDGLILKDERSSGQLEPRIEKSRTTTTYDYDAKFTIEAPKM